MYFMSVFYECCLANDKKGKNDYTVIFFFNFFFYENVCCDPSLELPQ